MALDPSQILPDQSQDPSQPQQPPAPANNAQNAGPVKAGLRGVLARMLGNFSYGAGQSMIAASGGETDAAKSTRLATTAHLNAQTQLAQAQATMTPVQLPNGGMIYLPAQAAAGIAKQLVANQGKTDVAQIGVDGPTLTPEQAQAMGHPELAGQGFNKAIAGVIQNQAGKMPITQDMIDRYKLPQESMGKMAKISDVISAERLQMQGTRTTTGGTWKETSPGDWTFLPTSSTTVRGTPGNAAPQAPGATPGASNHPILNNPNAPAHLKHFLGGGPIYAFDPKTNDTVLTTPAEQQANGYTNPRKASATEIMGDTQLNNRLTDVATKVQRYEDAMNAPISQADRDMISGVLSSDSFKLGAHGFGAGVEIPVDRLNQYLDAANVKNMSAPAKNALLAYLNARESMMGYTRVLTGSSRGSDTSLGLNLQALPSPVMPNDYIKNGVEQFKQNISLAGRGLPRMPGIPQAKDVMGQAAAESSAPSVRIKLSDGRTGTIPASSLPKYQKMGATVIQ